MYMCMCMHMCICHVMFMFMFMCMCEPSAFSRGALGAPYSYTRGLIVYQSRISVYYEGSGRV